MTTNKSDNQNNDIELSQIVTKSESGVNTRLHCVCRQKCDPKDSREMVQCNQSKDWFHFHCAGYVGSENDINIFTQNSIEEAETDINGYVQVVK